MRRGAIIVNPSKVKHAGALREQLTGVFRRYGWADPLWWETTVASPGTEQALAAVDAGADLVAALGGDGTVRCVAAGLLASRTPLAVLASGTGNLLARQLHLPVGHYANGLRAALAGRPRPIDVMRIARDVTGDGEFGPDEIGLVMGGIGLDADIMDATDDRLKSRIGWLAYPAVGLRHFTHELITARLSFDDDTHVRREVSSVLVGNCGLLAGGVRLMPDAVVDDGLLNAVLLRGGGVRWAPVLAKVLSRSTRDSGALERHRVTELTVAVDRSSLVEVDGDVLGPARVVRFGVDPGALLLCCPT